MTRFYDIDSGRILVDGIDIRDPQVNDLRRKLGIVLQDTYLFADTVMENIRYGGLAATDDEVVAAAKIANADQFIRRLPQGYATPLSERGSNLSQGQLTLILSALCQPHQALTHRATPSRLMTCRKDGWQSSGATRSSLNSGLMPVTTATAR